MKAFKTRIKLKDLRSIMDIIEKEDVFLLNEVEVS
jgi:hypothetical protein